MIVECDSGWKFNVKQAKDIGITTIETTSDYEGTFDTPMALTIHYLVAFGVGNIQFRGKRILTDENRVILSSSDWDTVSNGCKELFKALKNGEACWSADEWLYKEAHRRRRERLAKKIEVIT